MPDPSGPYWAWLTMRKWLTNLLALVIVAGLVYYVVGRWEELRGLLKLNVGCLATVVLVSLAANLVASKTMQELLRALDVKPSLTDLWLIQNAGQLLNYLPMKAGTVLRANYLKRRYGFGYAQFGAFFLQSLLLMTASAAVLGLGVLLAVYDLGSAARRILATAFAGVLVASLLALLLPIPLPGGPGRLSRLLRSFLAARKELAGRWKTLGVCTALSVVSYALFAVRLGAVYHSMGVDVHPAGFLILGCLAGPLMFLSITPGSLGIRELVLGASAVTLGVTPEVGILAAMIERAIVLGFTVVVGGACAAWLWRRYPADFQAQADGGEPA